MVKVIGVVGFLGSGKGTVGDILVDNYQFKKMAFADPLKDAVSNIFGWPRHLLEGDTKESRDFREQVNDYWTKKMGRNITPRKVLQLVGSECMRDTFGPDIWVAALERKIITDYWNSSVVITDCRFPNEIEAIRRMGGKVVRVVRGPEPEWYKAAWHDNEGLTCNSMSKYPNIHISEYAWIGQEFDFIIDNNSDLNHLNNEVTKMLLSIDKENILLDNHLLGVHNEAE